MFLPQADGQPLQNGVVAEVAASRVAADEQADRLFRADGRQERAVECLGFVGHAGGGKGLFHRIAQGRRGRGEQSCKVIGKQAGGDGFCAATAEIRERGGRVARPQNAAAALVPREQDGAPAGGGFQRDPRHADGHAVRAIKRRHVVNRSDRAHDLPPRAAVHHVCTLPHVFRHTPAARDRYGEVGELPEQSGDDLGQQFGNAGAVGVKAADKEHAVRRRGKVGRGRGEAVGVNAVRDDMNALRGGAGVRKKPLAQILADRDYGGVSAHTVCCNAEFRGVNRHDPGGAATVQATVQAREKNPHRARVRVEDVVLPAAGFVCNGVECGE